MQYLSNHLTDFDEICMVMHISLSDPISDQNFFYKFENPRLWTAAILKTEKTLYLVCPIFDKILRGGVDLTSSP